jgi:hypothetical protein
MQKIVQILLLIFAQNVFILLILQLVKPFGSLLCGDFGRVLIVIVVTEDLLLEDQGESTVVSVVCTQLT